MKRSLFLCAACLLTLTACSGSGSPIPSAPPTTPAPAVQVTPAPTPAPIQPIPLTAQITQASPWSFDPSEFPPQFPASAAIGDDSPLYLIAQLPEENISVYGLNANRDLERYPALLDAQGEEFYDGVILQVGEQWAAYPLDWCTPRRFLPDLFSGDFDGDGAPELALCPYTGSGTGVSYYTLNLIELDDPWTVRTYENFGDDPALSFSFQREADKVTVHLDSLSATFTLPDYLTVPADAPLEFYTGTIVSYEGDGDRLLTHMCVGLHIPDLIPYTACYPLELEGQILYDGQSLSFLPLSLTAPPQ